MRGATPLSLTHALGVLLSRFRKVEDPEVNREEILRVFI
jgi:hypothetical protein